MITLMNQSFPTRSALRRHVKDILETTRTRERLTGPAHDLLEVFSWTGAEVDALADETPFSHYEVRPNKKLKLGFYAVFQDGTAVKIRWKRAAKTVNYAG